MSLQQIRHFEQQQQKIATMVTAVVTTTFQTRVLTAPFSSFALRSKFLWNQLKEIHHRRTQKAYTNHAFCHDFMNTLDALCGT